MWAAGGCAVTAWIAIPAAMSVEVALAQDYDAVTFDLQHGLMGYDGVVPLLHAAHGRGRTVLARAPWNSPGIMGKLLDAGCMGIICPMVNTAEEAARFVGACRYAPRGYRSTGPIRVGLLHDGYAEQANDAVVTLAMVETEEAVRNLDGILATPHLTGVYVGPGDLALSMGLRPRLDPTDPRVLAQVAWILAKTHAAGLKCGIHCGTPAATAEAVAQGFDFVALGTDVRMLKAAQSAEVTAFRRLSRGAQRQRRQLRASGDAAAAAAAAAGSALSPPPPAGHPA